MLKESALSVKMLGRFREALRHDTPFLLKPIEAGLGKAFGKKKVQDALWKYYQKPILKADHAVGNTFKNLGNKVLKSKKGKSGLWDEKFVFDSKSSLPKVPGSGYTGRKEYEVPFGTTPIKKISRFAMPMLAAAKLENMLGEKKKMKNTNKITKSELQKTAEMLESLVTQKNDFEKKAHATKLLFKQAELGQSLFPKTHEEFEEKVAELMHKDLNVVEEAIKMAAATEEFSNTFGGLSDNDKTAQVGAQKAFQQQLME